MGASSKMTCAAFPPNSKVRCFEEPASSSRISLPTWVEPVKATLSTSGWETTSAPVPPAPVTTLSAPGGSPASSVSWAKTSAVSGVVSAGLSTTEFPVARAGVLQLVRPARVVEEMCGNQGEIDVTRLFDRLAPVQRLQDGELPGALLDHAGNTEHELCPLSWGHRPPISLEGPAAGGGALVPPRLARLGHLGELLFGGGVDGGEVVTRLRLSHLPVDVEAISVL